MEQERQTIVIDLDQEAKKAEDLLPPLEPIDWDEIRAREPRVLNSSPLVTDPRKQVELVLRLPGLDQEGFLKLFEAIQEDQKTRAEEKVAREARKRKE